MQYIDSERRHEIERSNERAFIVWSLISMIMIGLVGFGIYTSVMRDTAIETRDVTGLVRTSDYAVLSRSDWMGHSQDDWE